MTSNVSASVKARLLNKVDSDRTRFGLLLVRYACERFLYRLGKSGEPCVLKGATLLGIWMEEPHRTTRDIDLLTTGENDGQETAATHDGLQAPLCAGAFESSKTNSCPAKTVQVQWPCPPYRNAL